MKKVTTCDTAILIFAKSAKAESKHLISHRANNKGLISLLNQKVEGISKQSHLPYFVFDERKQNGSSFGERLSNAFEQVYSLGFRHVIAVGNDCPTLTANDLILADNSLRSGKSVLGPDKRGGIYLLGISKENFRNSLIRRSNWQDKSTFKSLLYTLDSCHILESKRDLNNNTDFRAFINNCSDDILLKQINELLNPKVQLNRLHLTTTYSVASNRTILRGPPFLLH